MSGWVQLVWKCFPFRKREKCILKFYLAPLGSRIRAWMLLKGEGFSNYDRGKTTWTVDYFKINRGCSLVVSHSSVYSTTPHLVTSMQINARKTNKRGREGQTDLNPTEKATTTKIFYSPFFNTSSALLPRKLTLIKEILRIHRKVCIRILLNWVIFAENQKDSPWLFLDILASSQINV